MLAYPTLLTSSYRNAIVNSVGLAGYWRLGDSTGTVAKDETGRNNGTYAASPTLGAVGGLSGDPNTGVGFLRASVQQVTTAAVVTALTNNYTAMCWLYKTVSFQDFECVFYNGNVTGGGPYNGWGLYIGASAKLWGLAQSVGDLTTATTGAVLSTLQWYQVTLLRQNGTSYSFLNGALNQTGTTNLPSMPTVQTVIASEAAGNNFNGTIDEMAIWNRALAPAEIANLYRIGRGF